MSDLCDRTASELAADLAAGDVKATEILDSCLERVDAVEEQVRSFLKLTPEFAHELADDAGGRFADGGLPEPDVVRRHVQVTGLGAELLDRRKVAVLQALGDVRVPALDDGDAGTGVAE